MTHQTATVQLPTLLERVPVSSSEFRWKRVVDENEQSILETAHNQEQSPLRAFFHCMVNGAIAPGTIALMIGDK